MILKGNQRANGQELAMHLLNAHDNEHVTVHELRGYLAEDLAGAFKETEMVSLGTKCQQYLFSLSLNPPPTAKVSVEEFETVIGDIERRLGMGDQPRAIVFHEKHGRRHAHCVWSRIDTAQMRAINLPHFKRRLVDVSRELYQHYGWDMPAGLRLSKDREPDAFAHQEAGQAKRVKRDPKVLKALFQKAWTASDNQTSFAAALLDEGFILARGDRRGFVAVDINGEIYSLSRWCSVKAKDLRDRLGSHDDLPDVIEAQAVLAAVTTPKTTKAHDHASEKLREEFAAERAALVECQRMERQVLTAEQESRRVEEISARHATLPTGLRATWARLTGQYQRQCAQFAREAQACLTRDCQETQELIDTHLAQRRQLDHKHALREAKLAFAHDISAAMSPALANTFAYDPRQYLVLPCDVLPFSKQQLQAQPDLIVDHINDKQETFTRTDILRALAEHIDDPFELRAAIGAIIASPKLARVQDGKFTTQAFIEISKQLHQNTCEMAGSGGFKVQVAHIERAIKSKNAELQNQVGAILGDEQVVAIRHVLKPNQLTSVVGLAGAGKSTLLSVARRAWEAQGYRVHGAALAGKAADGLQNASGIVSRTLASLETSWKNGYEPVGCGDIVVVDEAGMVGTRQLARVAEGLRNRGCKLVLVGDPDQLQPIEAGTPFRDVVASTGAAKLSEIRRQKQAWQRMASQDLANGQSESALQTYADHGAVHDMPDRDHAIGALVADYIADWDTYGECKSRLALAHRRKDVYAINQAIRAARNATAPPSHEMLVETDHGPRAFTVGDRILFTRNDATLNVRNGLLGTVQFVGESRLRVEFDVDDAGDKHRLTFSTRDFSAIDHGFAVSIHRSQGCTVDRSFVLSSRNLDQNLTYVAMTRHREEVGLYKAPEIELNLPTQVPVKYRHFRIPV
ncbi:MAG: AAA family ATPase [Paracoccaceae bacterium]